FAPIVANSSDARSTDDPYNLSRFLQAQADDYEQAHPSPSSPRGEKNDAVVEPCPGPAPTAEQVFREHAPRGSRLARRMLSNESDAEAVTSEVLLQVVRKLATFRGESSLATWLYRITANAALALRRKRATHPERQISDPMDQFLADG